VSVSMSLSFDNTEIAFRHLNDKNLKHAYRMFWAMNRPVLQKTGSGFTKWAIKFHLPVNSIVKHFVFRQFCGGESLIESIPVIKNMAHYKVFTALDYGVEGKSREADFRNTARVMIRNIEFAHSNNYVPFISCKLSGLVRFSLLQKIHDDIALNDIEQKEWDRFYHRFKQICQKAADEDTAIFVDAEETWIQKPIDRIVHDMMAIFNKKKAIVFNTVQMYCTDRLRFLRKSIKEAEAKGYFYGIKMVRGAYMEKERERAGKTGYPSPIHLTKEATDKDYDASIKLCFDHLENVAFCAATHNEKSSAYLAQLIVENKIPKNHPHIYFAQLYGMSDHITYNLAASGFNAGKYLPYGPVREVMPYLIRRSEENTSVAGQMGRELQLLRTEMTRRKLI